MIRLRRSLPLAVLIALSASAHADPYTAKVYAAGSKRGEPLFNLVRKETGTPEHLEVFSEFTDARTGEKAVTERTVIENGALKKYTQLQHQLGETGSIEVVGGKVRFTYTKEGKTETSEEDASDNLAVGANTVEYLRRHWPALLAGETIKIRFGVPDRKETVGFEFSKWAEKKVDGKTLLQVRMKPTSFFIAAIVKPLIFTFDPESRRLVELEGRTIPKQKVDGKWKDLVADIFYTY